MKALRVICLLVALGTAVVALAADPTGTWKWTTRSPNGDIETTLKLESTDGKLSGAYSNQFGDTAISNVSFQDDVIAFDVVRDFGGNKYVVMKGGTTFYFVTGGIHEALDRARDAANGMDVRIGGGPNTIPQYLRPGLIDELHVALSPVLLGGGERLFEGIDMRALGYECVQFVASEKATHVVLRRQGHNDT